MTAARYLEDTGDYTTTYTYHVLDRMQTMTYPEGAVVTHDTDHRGPLMTPAGSFGGSSWVKRPTAPESQGSQIASPRNCEIPVLVDGLTVAATPL